MLELEEWIPENCDSVTKAVTNILKKAPLKSLSENLDDVFDEYHNAVCSIESTGNAFLDTLMGIGIGAADTAVGVCEGTKQIVDHPLETALNLAMLMHPIYRKHFLHQATQQFKNFAQEDIIDGDPLTRSKGISRVACEIGLLAASFLKASGVSKCAEGAKVAEDVGEVAKAAEFANEAKNVAKASGGYKVDLQRFGRGAEEVGVAGGAAKDAGLKAGLLEGISAAASDDAGIITKNGIKIEEITSHGVNRAIGDNFKRVGVKPDEILDALKNPLKINDIITDSLGRQSQRFIGKAAEVVINPSTGKIVSMNPTSSSKVVKLLKDLGGE